MHDLICQASFLMKFGVEIASPTFWALTLASASVLNGALPA